MISNTFKKKLILVGGNSSVVQTILSKKENYQNYSNVYLLCHRKYNGVKIKSELIENIDPLFIIKLFNDILSLETKEKIFDVLISNTPTKNLNLKNNTTLEWSLSSIKLMNYLFSSERVNRVIFLGSVISFVPFYKNGLYKSIKKIEFYCFYELGYFKSNKMAFCILPPLRPGVNGLGMLFSQSKEKWAQRIIKEFYTNKSIIMPSKLIGIILKIILLTKNIKT